MSGCPSGKRRHATQAAAHVALDQIAEMPNRVGRKREQRAYRCRMCRGWHLTSSVRR